jgi:hypothetical protein
MWTVAVCAESGHGRPPSSREFRQLGREGGTAEPSGEAVATESRHSTGASESNRDMTWVSCRDLHSVQTRTRRPSGYRSSSTRPGPKGPRSGTRTASPRPIKRPVARIPVIHRAPLEASCLVGNYALLVWRRRHGSATAADRPRVPPPETLHQGLQPTLAHYGRRIGGYAARAAQRGVGTKFVR